MARPSNLALPLAAALLLGACGAKSSQGPGDAGAGGPDAGDGPDAGTGFRWPVPTGPIAITPSPFWKNRLRFESEPFAAGTYDRTRWVKFTVLMRDPTKVYFQDSLRYPLHFDFATRHLDPFVGFTAPQFEAVSLHEAGQEAITGAVLLPAVRTTRELGVQLVRQDAYPKEMVKRVFDLVRDAVDGPAGLTAYYMPTLEQEPSARANRGWLEARGVPLSSMDRWEPGSICYASGWALGRLRHVAPEAIDAAYRDRRLLGTDILVTDGVPAELPPLAGVVTTRPSTPNSHVAILAATLGIPFVYTPHEADVAALAALEGKEVLLRTDGQGLGDGCSLDALELDPALPAAVRAELLALKAPPALDLTPKARKGAFSLPVDALGPADVAYVGGKAANFGVLRRAIPDSAYPAVALTFDLWDDLLAQPAGTGKTLAAELSERLAPHRAYPPADLAALQQALAGVRALVRQTPLSPAAQAAVRAALAGFDATRRLRFRSSTNVEDAADFTGAGLYDSATGCLADDLDGDDAGPSACNGASTAENGAYRALGRVYASFYNDHAYLERVRHAVDEAAVGMAVLVHHSVPDELEQANGVVTLRASSYDTLRIVTQLGADSVTNPTGLSAPEVVQAHVFRTDTLFERLRDSSRVPLGSSVMRHPDDYLALVDLVEKVKAEFQKTTSATEYTLDLEFKKIAPGKLFLKQVRQVPTPSHVASVTPFLLNRPRRLCAAQGEYSDVLAIHRAKVRFSLTTRNVRLTPAERAASLFGACELEYPDGDGRASLTGAVSSWPSFSHGVNGEEVADTFALFSPARTVTLSARLPLLVIPAASPVITELPVYLTTRYAEPQPALTYQGIGTTTEEIVVLAACQEDVQVTSLFPLQTRTFQGPSGITVRTQYHWPPPPTGPVAGYTAPLVKWVKTEISGLTATPLVLASEWAQSYRPEHHNFSENFLFDPARDPSVTAAQRAELSAKDVRWLIVSGTPSSATFFALGTSGQLRKL